MAPSGLNVSVDNMQIFAACIHPTVRAILVLSEQHLYICTFSTYVHSEVHWPLTKPANVVACKRKSFACSYACLKNILDSMVTVCASVRQHTTSSCQHWHIPFTPQNKLHLHMQVFVMSLQLAAV